MPRHAPKRNNKFPRKNFRRNPRKTRRNPKAAYKLKNKKAFKAASNPLSENKQLEGTQMAGDVGANNLGGRILTDYSTAPANQSGHIMNSPHWNFNPDSMMYHTHGFQDHQMVGRSVYQTLCAAKFLIKWPQPSMKIGVNKYGTADDLGGVVPNQPMSYKIYWGYVPMKLLLTGKTTPTAPNASAHYIETQINERVKDYFDERRDRISFIPKTTATLKIIGSKVLKPPWRTHTGRKPVSMISETTRISTIDGNPVVYDPNTLRYAKESIPDTLVKIKWPINRKIHYEPTQAIGDAPTTPPTTGIATTPQVFYRNYDWQPFAVIVSWNHNKLPIDDPTATHDLQFERRRRSPQVLVNDITYYRDS